MGSVNLSEEAIDGLVTLQERMVNLIKQLNMPLVEVSMVIQNMISPMLESLNKHAVENALELPDRIMNQWPIEKPIHDEVKSSLAVEKILSVIDEERMDILETLVRVTMVETEMILLDGIAALRMWEHLARTQLANITSPGQLFSPIEIPEDW
ncbi:MAG: hypothetical protein CM15mP2_1010 [Methanobacteriota archaeon]|jgi:hypothetical protein|nr:MAG: hypothetical protein CM15mP2_1010 [Euryarchaeota archaeon]|tara:strand:+ start:2800 stop:3258 length:459 start_codon:yes stop_codon:yes gene_type:complete